MELFIVLYTNAIVLHSVQGFPFGREKATRVKKGVARKHTWILGYLLPQKKDEHIMTILLNPSTINYC